MGHMRPIEVEAAIERGDTYALMLMGRSGGRTTQRRRDVQKAVDEEYRQRVAQERETLAEQANEHLVPVDDTPQGNIFTHDELRSDI